MDSRQRDQYNQQISQLQSLLNQQDQKLKDVNTERETLVRNTQTEKTKIETAHNARMATITQGHEREMAQLRASIAEKKRQIEQQKVADAQEEQNLRAQIEKSKAEFQKELTSERGRKAQMEMNYDEIIESQDFLKYQVDPAGLDAHCRDNKNKPTVAYRKAKEALQRVMGPAHTPQFVERINNLLRRVSPEIRKCWANMIADMDNKSLNYQPVLTKGVSLTQVIEGLLTALKRDRRYTRQKVGTQNQTMKSQDYILVDATPQGSLVYKLEARITAGKDLKDQELDSVYEIVFC